MHSELFRPLKIDNIAAPVNTQTSLAKSSDGISSPLKDQGPGARTAPFLCLSVYGGPYGAALGLAASLVAVLLTLYGLPPLPISSGGWQTKT
jgi:hypothetical protein